MWTNHGFKVGKSRFTLSGQPRLRLMRLGRFVLAGVIGTLEDNANFVYERLKSIPGIKAVRPQGSMFMLVNVREVNPDDLIFARDCFDRQRIIVLPGTVFGVPGYVRITFSAPRHVLMEVSERGLCAQQVSQLL
mmetsp:Transcript_23140/g.92511  ORF Transcript_23140/g.92511 Transcript_23140/m.92511 type:complete len:134 (+) Transcript_23140:1223-1624(+)